MEAPVPVTLASSSDTLSYAAGMMMTNGLGATIGSFCAQAVVNHFTLGKTNFDELMAGWSSAWYVFAAFALVVGILFAILFKYKHEPEKEQQAK